MGKLNEGDKAPDFKVLDDSGKKISLKDYKGKKVVLYFYPKDMTPGCTTEAIEFQENMSKIKQKKTIVLGVSKDSAERHIKFKDKHDLKFPLLVDEDGELCEKYGVWQEKSLYGKKFMGIVRSTFIIDEKGKLLKVFPKVRVKGHVEEVLTYL